MRLTCKSKWKLGTTSSLGSSTSSSGSSTSSSGSSTSSLGSLGSSTSSSTTVCATSYSARFRGNQRGGIGIIWAKPQANWLPGILQILSRDNR